MQFVPVAPEACPPLVLNADFRPLSYYPLSLWSWQDAIKAVTTPVIEVHLSNPHARESFRHVSLIGQAAKGTIAGFGASTNMSS